MCYLISCVGFEITHYGWSWMVSWFWVLAGLLLLIKLMWSIVNVIYPFCRGGGGALYLQLSIKAMFMSLKTQIYYLASCNSFEITHYGWSWMVSWFCVLVLACLFMWRQLMLSIQGFGWFPVVFFFFFFQFFFFLGGGGGGGGFTDEYKSNVYVFEKNILSWLSQVIVDVIYPGLWMVPSALFFHFFFSYFWQGGGGGCGGCIYSWV